MSDGIDISKESQTYRWTSAKELLLRQPKTEREPWLKDELGAFGMIVGGAAGVLLLSLLWVLHIRSTTVWSMLLLAAIGAGYVLFARLPRYIGESASLDLILRVNCVIGKHDFKPDGSFHFLHNGCECVRCHYRPSGRALMKAR